MKRSRYVRLISMGASVLAMAACDEAPSLDAYVYDDVGQCIADSKVAADQCEAKVRHAEVAPKFESKEDCEAEFGVGRCETKPLEPLAPEAETPHQVSSGGSGGHPVFFPYMMGGANSSVA